jgi:hypothetical protein
MKRAFLFFITKKKKKKCTKGDQIIQITNNKKKRKKKKPCVGHCCHLNAKIPKILYKTVPSSILLSRRFTNIKLQKQRRESVFV